MGAEDGWRLETPTSFDVAWTATIGAVALLLVAALVVWVVRRQGADAALADLLLIVLVPILGPAAYLLGERVRRRWRAGRARTSVIERDARVAEHSPAQTAAPRD